MTHLMALTVSTLNSLILTFGLVTAATIATLLLYSKTKNKKTTGWLAVANLSLIVWTVFHLFLDFEIFPAQFVEFIHYWIVHIFIIITSACIYQSAKTAQHRK